MHNLTHNVCSKLGNEDKQLTPLDEKLAGISRESLLRGAVVEGDTDVQDPDDPSSLCNVYSPVESESFTFKLC